MTREKAIQILEQRLSTAKYLEYSYIDCVDAEALEVAIEALKEPRITASWKIDWDWGIATCTNCKKYYDDGDNGYLLGDELQYCPFCGAKMDNYNNKGGKND